MPGVSGRRRRTRQRQEVTRRTGTYTQVNNGVEENERFFICTFMAPCFYCMRHYMPSTDLTALKLPPLIHLCRHKHKHIKIQVTIQ